MLSTTTLAAIIGLLGFFAYKFLILPVFLSPLSKLPTAHPLCSVSQRWLERQLKQRSEVKTLFAAHRKHGPVVRIGPQEVSVVSLEGLRQVYTAGLEKTPWYDGKFENYKTPNLVSTLDHRSHSIQKRMSSSVYAKSYVQHSADLAAATSKIIRGKFLPLLRSYSEGSSHVNVMDLFQWTGIDLMTAYLFGTSNSTDFLRDEEGREAYFGEWNKFRDSDLVGDKPIVEGLCMQLLRDALDTKEDARKPGETSPVVSTLLYTQLLQKAKAEGRESAQDALMERCASEMLDHIIATHETFAITLTYVVYRLSLNPSLQSALRSECSTLEPTISGEASRGTLPHPDQVDGLPLLNGVLRETLRLYAAVPGRLPRMVPASGITLHGYFIPSGTTVSSNAYSLHRQAEIFPRPDEWLPQRWLSEKDRSTIGDGFPPPEIISRHLWTFGSGGRMCIGSNWAIQVLKTLIAATYTNFTTTIVDDEGIEQGLGFIAGPKSNKLIIQFHAVREHEP